MPFKANDPRTGEWARRGGRARSVATVRAFVRQLVAAGASAEVVRLSVEHARTRYLAGHKAGMRLSYRKGFADALGERVA